CDKCDSTCEQKNTFWGRGTLPKEITGLFEFGEFREIEKKYIKKRKLDINELKANEHSSRIDSNKMLLDNKTSLEIFKKNKDKIPY
ncbi:451_t:CDS:1, partial [Racocetra persica]